MGQLLLNWDGTGIDHGRSVSGLKFPSLFRCADSFTWATRIPSSDQR